MVDEIDIRVIGQHGSISNLEWLGVPRFAVLTGENGVGKTQLLDVIAHTYGAMQPQLWATVPGFPQVQPKARAEIVGGTISSGEVFHSRADWRPFGNSRATLETALETIRDLQHNTPDATPWFWNKLAESSGRSVEELSGLKPEDFRSLLTPMLVWGAGALRSPTQDLDFLFLLYRLFEHEASADGFDEKVIIELYGQAPWIIINEVFQVAGLRYRVDPPTPFPKKRLAGDPSVTVRLRDVETGDRISLAELSSGENVLISTALWAFGAGLIGKYPRLLLLDEPDAHLHPSFTRLFLQIIDDVFIQAHEVRVIMTSHSPSTVALTPEGSLFEMRRTAIPRIVRPKTKAHAIALLTAGLLVVEEATNFVFVEGPDDPRFYALIWELVTRREEGLEAGWVLEPSPNLLFIHGAGDKTIYAIVSQFRKLGLTRFHGIVDRDKGNTSAPGMYVIQRNAIENYLYDPLNVWVCLHREGKEPPVNGINIPKGRSDLIGRLQPTQLQQIVDEVCGLVERTNPSVIGVQHQRNEVSFVGSVVLSYPTWVLALDDKKLRHAFHETFVFGDEADNKLHQSFATLRLIPHDLRDILKAIQDEAILKKA